MKTKLDFVQKIKSFLLLKLQRLKCSHTFHLSCLSLNEKMVEISSECVYCGKIKIYKINGAVGGTFYDNPVLPCVYLFSKRTDFQKRYDKMKKFN